RRPRAPSSSRLPSASSSASTRRGGRPAWSRSRRSATSSKNVGFFGNATNGDLADLSYPHDPGNCWHGNRDASHEVSSAPDGLETTHRRCGVPNAGDDPLMSRLSNQVLCATELLGPCPEDPDHHYPRATGVQLKALRPQRAMRNPCKGLPS